VLAGSAPLAWLRPPAHLAGSASRLPAQAVPECMDGSHHLPNARVERWTAHQVAGSRCISPTQMAYCCRPRRSRPLRLAAGCWHAGQGGSCGTRSPPTLPHGQLDRKSLSRGAQPWRAPPARQVVRQGGEPAKGGDGDQQGCDAQAERGRSLSARSGRPGHPSRWTLGAAGPASRHVAC